MKELAPRRTRSPDLNDPAPGYLRDMDLAEQGCEDVALLRVEVVSRTVKIGT
jgi:hypothetical protein